jgi:hypothetical protein
METETIKSLKQSKKVLLVVVEKRSERLWKTLFVMKATNRLAIACAPDRRSRQATRSYKSIQVHLITSKKSEKQSCLL